MRREQNFTVKRVIDAKVTAMLPIYMESLRNASRIPINEKEWRGDAIVIELKLGGDAADQRELTIRFSPIGAPR